MRTLSSKKSEIVQKWYVVDADGQILGRLASQVASVLRGKHRPSFTPHVDMGDHVVVINCEKVILTGQKLRQKMYHRHSGYPGGLHSVDAGKMMREKPERVVTWAIEGMLPKNKLGKAMARKLRVYVGTAHPHIAQNPEPMKLEARTAV